jgi:hypothetical protein
MAKKSDKKVKDLYALFGGANFADILNRLWMMGKDPKELQRALAQTANGTNDPTDIIARLLNYGIATEDEIRLAPTLPVPEGVRWAFGPENVQDGVVRPWHLDPFQTAAGPFLPSKGILPPRMAPAAPAAPAPQQPAAPQSRVPNVPGMGQSGGDGRFAAALGTMFSQAGLAGKPKDVTIGDADEAIRRTYGYSAFALDIPEIRSVLEQAAAGDWDDNRIIGAISNTNWWRRTSDAERKWTALANQDGATATRQIKLRRDQLFSQVRASGFVVDEGRLMQIAELSLKYGWSPQEVQRALASEFKYDPTGERQAFATNLKRLANEYVIPMSDNNIERWGQMLLSGEFTEDDFTNYLIESAKGMFPGMAAALDRGMTVRQYADPYLQMAGKILETDPDTLDLTEGKWIRAINQIDPKTGERTVMQLGDWERTLKLDPQYGYDRTKGAREEAVALGTGLLKTFGAL